MGQDKRMEDYTMFRQEQNIGKKNIASSIQSPVGTQYG